MKRVAVATSGGRDSTALLHCTLRMAQPLGVEVVALHVHHGLMPQADAWQAQVRRQARRWGAAFEGRRLAGQPGPGDSIEAWARRERYAALADMARSAGAELVLLAHHQRDQAETWLLQALRGGGPAGLAAMPRLARRGGLTWARPWLDQPRESIDDYLRRHRLRAVDDPSNADPRFARSRLRVQLWPALRAAFPDAEQALAMSSRRAQEAAALADEVALLDLPGCVSVDDSPGELLIEPWLALPPARRTNVLRAWLAQAGAGPVPESLVQRLLREIVGEPAAGLPAELRGGLRTEHTARRSARFPAVGAELRLYRGRLRFVRMPMSMAMPIPQSQTQTQTQTEKQAQAQRQAQARPLRQAAAVPLPPAAMAPLDLARPGRHGLPGWSGALEVTPCRQGGVPADLLQGVQARARRGGEQFRRAPNTPPRSLKKQAQGLAVPAWQRDGPLLYTAAGDLLFVPWLGLDARCLAAPGQAQFSLVWRPATGPSQAEN